MENFKMVFENHELAGPFLRCYPKFAFVGYLKREKALSRGILLNALMLTASLILPQFHLQPKKLSIYLKKYNFYVQPHCHLIFFLPTKMVPLHINCSRERLLRWNRLYCCAV